MLFVLLMACATRNGEMPELPDDEAPGAEVEAAASTRVAVARLEPRSGTATGGTVTFTETVWPDRSELRLVVDLEGATPGAHAVRIHAQGDCSAADASSAGAPFRPMPTGEGAAPSGTTPGAGTTPPSGSPAPSSSAPGGTAADLEVTVGADGVGRAEQSLAGFTLGEGPTSISGRSVVVYERGREPDAATEPGRRVACGVVTASVARAR
jgi:Cu-Zn family superoxide dismutase